MKTPVDRIHTCFTALVLGAWMLPAGLFAQEVPQAPPAPMPPPAGQPTMRDGGPPGVQRQRMQMEMKRRMDLRREPGPGMVREGRPGSIRQKKPDGVAPGKPDMAPRARVQHLRQAAEHLQAAGFPEYAEKARKEADRIIEQVRRESAKDVNPELTEKIQKLSREVDELRQQIRRMKAEVTPKPRKEPEKRQEDRPADPQPQ